MTDNSQPTDARLILDFLHRLAMHHGMWYAEVRERLGPEKADEVFRKAYETSSSIQWKRLAKTLGFEMKDDVPAPIADLPADTLASLKEAVAINWLANDGVWFQSVEFSEDMTAAKACNDAAWSKFSPLEALSIRRLLGLGKRPGLDGLKKALEYRLYAAINVQSIDSETDNSFVFRMNDCRVQAARKRKGLDDYPCKSAGVIEYSTFAETIDPRIRTECVGCPPDDHPDEWYCAWRFILEE